GGGSRSTALAAAALAPAAGVAADAPLVNSGQSCIAAKRFIVVGAVREPFMKRFAAELGARRMGDPLAPDTQVGPQARIDLRDALHAQVEESMKRGARCVLGGRVPAGAGAAYPAAPPQAGGPGGAAPPAREGAAGAAPR